MKTKIALLALVLLWQTGHSQKMLKTNNAKVGFYSHTPVEDIEAISDKTSAVINPSNNQLAFALMNTSLKFDNSLMQEHFNEKYMESDKYPKSTFSGKINEVIDWSKDGDNKVTVTGKLLIHGVELERTLPANISIKNGKISATSEFMVKTAEHKITIPKLVWQKIAEEVKVNVTANFDEQ
jgi:polyisoprenoid-binding protein YceI